MDQPACRAAIVALLTTPCAPATVYNDAPDTIPDASAVIVRWTGTTITKEQATHTYTIECVATAGPVADRIAERDRLTGAVLTALNGAQGPGRPAASTAPVEIGLQQYTDMSAVTVTYTDDPTSK